MIRGAIFPAHLRSAGMIIFQRPAFWNFAICPPQIAVSVSHSLTRGHFSGKFCPI